MQEKRQRTWIGARVWSSHRRQPAWIIYDSSCFHPLHLHSIWFNLTWYTYDESLFFSSTALALRTCTQITRCWTLPRLVVPVLQHRWQSEHFLIFKVSMNSFIDKMPRVFPEKVEEDQPMSACPPNLSFHSPGAAQTPKSDVYSWIKCMNRENPIQKNNLGIISPLLILQPPRCMQRGWPTGPERGSNTERSTRKNGTVCIFATLWCHMISSVRLKVT